MIRRFVCLCLLSVNACAPLADFRPASGLMAGRELEVGAGAAAVTPRPYVDETWRGTGQLWVSSNALERKTTLSGIVAFDDQAAAVGGAMRFNLLRFDRFAGGMEFELGYLWGATSLPAAVRLFDESYLYVAPRLGNWGLDILFGVPVGLSLRIVDGFMLRLEWQRSWQAFQYYNRRDHLGAAVAYQF